MEITKSQKIEEIISTVSKTKAILVLLSLIEIEELDRESFGWICQILQNFTALIENELDRFLNNG